MSTNLMQAHNQWATRPADERFSTLGEMYAATLAHARRSLERDAQWADLRAVASGDDVLIVGKQKVPARVTNYAFGQIASRVGAPAGYLRTLPPTLAAQVLNYGLANREGGAASLLLEASADTGDPMVLRAATSDKYARIWNHEVLGRLIKVCDAYGLVPARQTFSWDGSPVDPDAPPALYASDHDMFAFVMAPNRDLVDPVGQPLHRGVIVANSEVGDRSLSFMAFYFREICGNHIIWGAEQITEVSLRHVGSIGKRMIDAQLEVRKYLDRSTGEDQKRLQAVTVRIADDREKVLDRLFGMRSLGLSRKALAASYDAVLPEVDGDPRTVWGMAQGVTRFSQQTAFADERTVLDRAAGRLLATSF